MYFPTKVDASLLLSPWLNLFIVRPLDISLNYSDFVLLECLNESYCLQIKYLGYVTLSQANRVKDSFVKSGYSKTSL